MVPTATYQRMRAAYQGVVAGAERTLRDMLATDLVRERELVRTLRRHLLTVERGALSTATHSGFVGEEVAQDAMVEIDRVLAELRAAEEH
jgi:hypothetical protein